LLELMANSTRELDEVIKDLNKIIDIRNEIYGLREKVFFKDEWAIIYKTLQPSLKPDMRLEIDFQDAPFVYTVRPILNSILYNLTSNAIKYHSPNRPLVVTIKTRPEGDSVLLEVRDNGLGMNMEQVGNNVFGLYKRFHNHTEGKGLGLYLVKSQIEAVGGRAEVSSELNVGTRFIIHFKIPQEIEGQVCFENDAGKVFYNGRINCAGVLWKKEVSSTQYRAVFLKCLEIVRLYHTPAWMGDIRLQGLLSDDDQKWMVHEILPDGARNGLQRVAVVYDIEQRNDDYRQRMKDACMKHGLEVEYFTDIKDAEWWIESFVLMNGQPEERT